MRIVRLLKTVHVSLCCLWLSFSLVSVAQGAMLDGTFGFVPLGSVSYSGINLGHATSLSLPAQGLINTIPDLYSGRPNDFSSTGAGTLNLFSQVNLSSLVLPLTGAIPLSDLLSFSSPGFAAGTTPSDRYVFDLQTLTTASSGASSLDLFGAGILHDTLNSFSDTPALLSLALTQSTPGAAVDASFSLATSVIPESGIVGTGVSVLCCILLLGQRAARGAQPLSSVTGGFACAQPPAAIIEPSGFGKSPQPAGLPDSCRRS